VLVLDRDRGLRQLEPREPRGLVFAEQRRGMPMARRRRIVSSASSEAEAEAAGGSSAATASGSSAATARGSSAATARASAAAEFAEAEADAPVEARARSASASAASSARSLASRTALRWPRLTYFSPPNASAFALRFRAISCARMSIATARAPGIARPGATGF
jgi:hypothetical protein